jgi:hypothetical protein
MYLAADYIHPTPAPRRALPREDLPSRPARRG